MTLVQLILIQQSFVRSKKMKCKACNKTMSPEAIKWNHLIDDWEVCGECLESVRDQLNSFDDEGTSVEPNQEHIDLMTDRWNWKK